MDALHIDDAHDDGHAHHIVPVRVYFIVYCILLALMAATVAVYYADFGPINNVIAMVIAVVKATLVVLYFMQVRYSSKLTMLWAALGFIWLFFLFSTVGDYLTRFWLRTKGF